MVYSDFNGLSISRLGMGNMRLPIIAGGKDKDIDYEKAQAIIDYAMQNGVNYFDSAYVYHAGESERFAGKALKKYPRESYYITTKYAFFANPDYKSVFAEQLERYQTDCIDFYLIHCLLDNNIEDYLTNGCIDYFLQMKKEGKIKYLGFSSHASVETLKRFADHHKWDFAQIQMNYYDWNYSSAKAEYQVLTERNIPIMVMESVRGGRLANLTAEAEKMLKDAQPDWSISSWAFRWLKRFPNVVVSLSGMSNLVQIEDNVKTFSDERALKDEEEKLLFKACELFQSQIKVPCTACRYCCDACPVQINIPEVLKVYNQFKLNGNQALEDLKKIESKGKPSDCVACKACTSHCPQSINIPLAMKELAAALVK